MTRRLVALLGALAAVAAVVAAPVAADPNNNNSAKLRQAVTLEGVQAHLAAFQAIADISGGNRFAGLSGYDRSADYVWEQLEAAGYDPEFWHFEYDAFVEEVTTQLRQDSPVPTTYVNGVDFRIMRFSGGGTTTAPLATPAVSAVGCVAADYAGFPAGAIALVSRGACSFRAKTNAATAAGASAIVVYNHIAGLLNGTLGDFGLSAIPALGTTQALGQSLLAQLASGPVVMTVRAQTSTRRLQTRNVMAELPGRNADNVITVGAHLDSVNAGPGIHDNGSGSAAILETAIQMSKVKPRNTVRFFWWGAEESGLIGSTRYVNSLPQAELDRIALNLNFDMIGSPNYVRFVYDGDNSAFPVGPGAAAGPPGSAQIEALFHEYFASQGLASAETPFSGRSDYGPFIAKGIPAGGLFTGAEGIKTAAQAATYGGTAGIAYDACYHADCDTYANVNPTVLDQNADAIAHATITYAQNTSAVNGVRGKGNFARSAGPANPDGTTSGEGGGLHEDHEPTDS